MGASHPGLESDDSLLDKKAHSEISEGAAGKIGVWKTKHSTDCNYFSLKCAVFSGSERKHVSSKSDKIELYHQSRKSTFS